MVRLQGPELRRGTAARVGGEKLRCVGRRRRGTAWLRRAGGGGEGDTSRRGSGGGAGGGGEGGAGHGEQER